MAVSRERQNHKTKITKFKTPRGVGLQRENPEDYVPTPGSPSLAKLRKFPKIQK